MEDNAFIDIPETKLRPGETIKGKILWALNQSPKSAQLTFGWWTEGRGSRDEEILFKKEWKTDASAGEETFEIKLPKSSPYSFSGHLISLKWAFELTFDECEATHLLDITVSSDGEVVELPLIDEGKKQSLSRRRR